MSRSVSGILLYDYAGRAIVAPRLNAGSNFEIPGTQFTNGFTLNGNTGNNNLERLLNSNLTLDRTFNFGQGPSPVRSGPTSSLDDLLNGELPRINNNLGYGNSNFGNTSNQTASGVIAPYQDRIDSYELTPQNFDQLMQQDSFVIPTGQTSLRVVTDGNGGVESVSLDPTNLALQSGTPANFQFPDRAQITTGATYQFGDISPLPAGQQPSPQSQNQPIFLNNQPQVQPSPPQNPFRALTPTAVNPTVTQPSYTPASVDSASNAVLQRLLARQPLDPGTRLFGADSQLTPQGARNIGAVQAGFGVDTQTPSMTENLAMLRNGLAAQAATSVQAIGRAVDGRIPVAPTLPFETTQVAQASQNTGNMFEQLQTTVDSQGSSGGGYIPFGQGSSGSEQGNQDPEERRQRRPLRITA